LTFSRRVPERVAQPVSLALHHQRRHATSMVPSARAYRPFPPSCSPRTTYDRRNNHASPRVAANRIPSLTHLSTSRPAATSLSPLCRRSVRPHDRRCRGRCGTARVRLRARATTTSSGAILVYTGASFMFESHHQPIDYLTIVYSSDGRRVGLLSRCVQ
jgi:hypothetical protein